ncbi:MAG: PilZ domain-containing protein [Wenzhouxiangella sp.]
MIDYEDRLVVAWEADEAADERDMERLESSNLAVLQGVSAVEEGVSHRLREEQPELYQEIERLNARLDLLVDMVGRLLAEHREQAPARRVRLAVEKMTFVAQPGEAAPGQRGRLCLHLHASVPEPLRLPGQLVSEHLDEAGRRWVDFQPFAMSGRLRDALGQLVFRHHRRMIAEQRSRRDHDAQG